MKYDPSQAEALARFLGKKAAGLANAGEALQKTGKNITQFGCSLMIVGLLGLALMWLIF